MRRPEVVAITGATAGVGRAVAFAFARQGAKVGLMARSRDGLESAKAEIASLGGAALALPTDVADWRQVETAADLIERKLGPIDVWINNAVTTVFSPFIEVPPDEYKRVTEVAYLGFVYGTRAALKRMRPRDRGVIVQVGSAQAYRSIPLQAAYCGAKHAIRGFTDSIRSELIHDRSRVRVTMVQLPGLNTPQFSWCKTRLSRHPQPLAPIYQPEVAARAVLWAARHSPRELSVGLPTVLAITANKLFPGAIDRYLARNGYERQQTRQPVNPSRSSNLFEPVPGFHQTQGIFSRRAHRRSLQLWLNTHRWAAGALLGVLAGGAAYLRLASGRGRATRTVSEAAATAEPALAR